MVTVTAANGCTRVLSVTVSNNNPPINLSSVIVANTFCVGGNGSIDLTASPSGPPYTYVWSNGPTTQDRSGLGDGTYKVTVSDANSCEALDQTLYLTQPERSDWTMSGNTGSNPGTHFIGTTDAKDVVFKSNGTEQLRLLNVGGVSLNSLAGTGDRLVYVDQNGVLKRNNDVVGDQMSIIPWYLGGNNDVATSLNRIGPVNEVDFNFITGNRQHMRITSSGEVQLANDLGNVPASDVPGRLNIRNGEGNWMTLRSESAAGYWAIHNPQEHDRLMFNFSVKIGNITSGEASHFVVIRPLQNQSKLFATMTMLRHRSTLTKF